MKSSLLFLSDSPLSCACHTRLRPAKVRLPSRTTATDCTSTTTWREPKNVSQMGKVCIYTFPDKEPSQTARPSCLRASCI
jgi:hypothetical protein